MANPNEIEVKDGETSELWRALQVETLSFDGVWLRRWDRWPFGITCKPGVDPAEIRAEVAKELSFPDLETKPSEVRLLDPWT